jgi:hypothetical protein
LFGKPVRRNRDGWGRRKAAQDLDDRPDRQGPVVPTSQTCFS